MPILLLVFILVVPSVGWAAVAIEGSCTVAEPAVCTTCDVTHTITSATALLVMMGINGAQTVSSSTWDFGGTAQSIGAAIASSTALIRDGYIFLLTNPTTGSNLTLRTVYSGNTTPQIVLCSLTGVNLSDPYETPVVTEGSGTESSISAAFSLGAGGLAISYFVIGNSVTGLTEGADQTAISFNNAFGDDDIGSSSYATVSPLNYTFNATSSNRWIIAVPLNAVSTRRPIAPMLLSWLHPLTTLWNFVTEPSYAFAR
jgi:hypothetical protein